MDYRERGAGRVRSTHEAFQPPATEKERERERETWEYTSPRITPPLRLARSLIHVHTYTCVYAGERGGFLRGSNGQVFTLARFVTSYRRALQPLFIRAPTTSRRLQLLI